MTTQWIELRSFYSLPLIFRQLPFSREIPTITHVPIQGTMNAVMPHETGIFVHVFDSDVGYDQLCQEDFNTAKENCVELLLEHGETFINEVSTIQDLEEPEEQVSNDVSKATHEYLAILHHYQIHFRNRNSP